MAGEETTNQGNIQTEYNAGVTGMNMDNTVNQIPKGTLTYALNAAIENFDSNSVNYQNEPGNEFCLNFPDGYQLIGEHFINEKNKHIFFIVNPETGDSQVGYMDNNDCIYHTYISAPCLNFNINYPIHKAVHKITNCTTEVYWTDGLNPRRFLDLENPPYTVKPGTSVCADETIPVVDCNKLKIQPNFNIPELSVVDIRNGGELVAGTYQFAVQYCDSLGDGFTSYYSVTNPTPMFDSKKITLDFNYTVGKSIILNITNIDTTGYFQYYNLAVIKTVNNITSVELVGTYFIDKPEKEITYTGQNQTQIRLTVDDVLLKFPYYEIAQDLTAVQDILVWDNLTSIDRINYQRIANQITLNWETWRIPNTEDYSDELNATNLRGYLRDEVYAFEIVFLLKNGKQTDGFHIPGRIKNSNELSQPQISTLSPDFIGDPEYTDPNTGIGYSPYWRIYNTGSVTGTSPLYNPNDPTYKGPYQYGEFAYWESKEVYPCNELVWGELANQPIRHHKFPDVLVSSIFENPEIIYSGNKLVPIMTKDAIYPMGVRIDISQVEQLIATSELTREEKDNIAGFKIVRGDRSTNKSIVAKGMLRNVGQYQREDEGSTPYLYPNYPYNSVQPDPFLQQNNNAFYDGCETYRIDTLITSEIQYTNCFTGNQVTITILGNKSIEICSLSLPIVLSGDTSFVGLANYSIWNIENTFIFSGMRVAYIDPRNPGTISLIWLRAQGYPGAREINILSTIPPYKYNGPAPMRYLHLELVNTVKSGRVCNSSTNNPLQAFGDNSMYRYVLNSPETSFGQPFLGNILRLESVMFGAGKAHFVQVRKHAMYKLLTKQAQEDALNSSWSIGLITGSVASGKFNSVAAFTAYQTYLQIYINGITRKNYAYSFNSIASYDYAFNIDNNIGLKQRPVTLAQYLIPTVQSVGDEHAINNYQREDSVYLKLPLERAPIPFAENTPSLSLNGQSTIVDDSRFIASDPRDPVLTNPCNTPETERSIKVVAYYGSLKNDFVNQWGQIYSYDTIDTGFQINLEPTLIGQQPFQTIFGGDTFICRFAYKTKFPFFIDNRVNAPDDSDVFYDEIGNVAYPKYWFSSRSVLSDANPGVFLSNFISYKAHNFDCPNNQEPKNNNPNRTFYDGKFYLFAYGIPNFYCESSINVDLRQAFNDREGNFWPHVGNNIPDDWLQESFVPIVQDNTYYYNVTYSRQNKENYFSHLPVDWKPLLCNTYFPFRAIYSDIQLSYANDAVNNWLIYRPISSFDFPQNYGNLTSLDSIQNKAILARFENKTLLYNNLLTIDTSNPQAAYIGNNKLFAGAPPIDFAETDLGYIGCQNKMLLKIPQGQVTIDAKRGQVFLVTGDGAVDLSQFKSGMNRFFTDHLAFEILRYFPDVNTDNHFNGIGLHGVYDSKYDRVIISKLDYIPTNDNVKYDSKTQEFYLEETLGESVIKTTIYVTDVEYFCNKSWTLSFNMNTKTWISFHSYIPNFYIAENNFFYTGLNGSCDLEAIAAEEVPYTTTSTTTFDPTPSSTTSTTTEALRCELEGELVGVLECELIAGSALKPGTTTTTSSSTTTTTTTICMNCNTYYITNTSNCEQELTWTSCNGVTDIGIVNPYENLHLCGCADPTPVEHFTIQLISEGCVSTFCYTFKNTTEEAQTIYWANEDNSTTTITLDAGKSYCICAVGGSCVAPEGVTITGGTVPCTLTNCPPNGGCGIPATPVSIGETYLSDCTSGCVYQYSIAQLPYGATSVNWIIPPGATIVEQTETTITVSYAYGSTGGSVSVYGVSDCGEGESLSLSVTLPDCTTTTTTTTTL